MSTEIKSQIFYYIGIFSPFFSGADFENFVILLLGFLSNSKNKTIAGIAESMDNFKDHSVLSKFLASSKISTYFLKAKMKELFLKMHDCTKPVFFYLDDSLVEKAGKKVKAAYNWSTTHRRPILSNCFVFGLVKNGSLELPFDFEKYLSKNEKNFRSKIDLALMLLKKFISWYGNNAYVLFDSWYSAAEVVNFLNGEKVVYITRVKGNRVAIFDSMKIQLKDYAMKLPADLFKSLKTETKEYFVYSEILYLKKIGKVKVIFSRKKKRGRKTVFLITNSFALEEKFVIESYIHRWEIEQFFKDMKTNLGFEEYQEIRQVGVSRHITLQLVAYFLTSVVGNFLEKTGKIAFSFGEVLKKIHSCFSEVKMKFLRRLYLRKLEVNTCS